MFSNPKVLAQSALDLLALARADDLPDATIVALELGAVTLCHHVKDWHDKAQLEPVSHSAFKEKFPEWAYLAQISNATKHAKPLLSDEGHVKVRGVEWEDSDFWNSDHGRDTLFVSIGGVPRSVSALVWTFAMSYLEQT